MANRNAKKGAAAEKKVAKGLDATRKAGPNRHDLDHRGLRTEVKSTKNPLTKGQLQSAYAQNHAQVIVSVPGFTKEAKEHARKNMPTVQLRKGRSGATLVKKRSTK